MLVKDTVFAVNFVTERMFAHLQATAEKYRIATSGYYSGCT